MESSNLLAIIDEKLEKQTSLNLRANKVNIL